jgi:Lon-like ATP-dependent protease
MTLKERFGNFFGKEKESIENTVWDWSAFRTTENFPVSKNLLDWVIGQEHALAETKLCIDEWIAKLLWLNKKEWWKVFEDPSKNKPQSREMLPAGPFLLLMGDPGTGKSLLGRAMSNYMTDLYQENSITLCDVLSWKNQVLPSQPRISIHLRGKGKEIIQAISRKVRKKSFWKSSGSKFLQGFMIVFGLGLIVGSLWSILGPWFSNPSVYDWATLETASLQTAYHGNLMAYFMEMLKGGYAALVIGGASLIFFAFFISYLGRMMGTSNMQGIGGASNSASPKLLIDNSGGEVPFIDATGHGSAQLFGSIAWDPYQTGGLGTPEHQRMTAGDVHRAHLGILFIDEIKNLTGQEAITLLTVLEDGQLPVALRSQFHGGDTAAMAVASEPIPAMFFLIAAGNLDSMKQIHPALLDRIQGYGKVVYMTNDMPDNIENRRKYVQFISQETKRFNLLPASKEACISIIGEARRKSGRNDKLTCKFRPMISVIKTASVLASNEGETVVSSRHVEEALSKHCKSLGFQVMEKQISNMAAFRIVNPHSKPKIGQIHGLGVHTLNEETQDKVGAVLIVKASAQKKHGQAYFVVTGTKKTEDSFIQDSISKVRHVILQRLGKNVSMDYCTHVDFAQEHEVDGPSAGITMTLCLLSALTKQKIKQDVAITGEINIGCEGQTLVTPIGGAHEKIMAAQAWGFKKVVIPLKNFEHSINSSDYKIKVVGAATLDDYIREVMIPKRKKNDKKGKNGIRR